MQQTQDVSATEVPTLYEKSLRILLFVFFAIMIIAFTAFLAVFLYFLMVKSQTAGEIASSPVVGVFVAFFLAIFIVLFLRYSAGPIEFEGLGFRFKGAAGPLVLWVLAFLAVIVGFVAL